MAKDKKKNKKKKEKNVPLSVDNAIKKTQQRRKELKKMLDAL